MKFTNTVIINRPIEVVFDFFKEPKYLKEYQESFIKKELISGIAGEVGSVSEMHYKNGKNVMVITETILVSDFPTEFFGSYHHKHMDNTMRCRFEKTGENQTKYISEVEYTAFRSFFPKLFAFLFPGMFKKQVQKWMDKLKEFAENK